MNYHVGFCRSCGEQLTVPVPGSQQVVCPKCGSLNTATTAPTTCQESGCEQRATYHLSDLEKKTVVHLCDEHARNHLT